MISKKDAFVIVRITIADKKRLLKEAVRRDINISKLIREVIDEYFRSEKKV